MHRCGFIHTPDLLKSAALKYHKKKMEARTYSRVLIALAAVTFVATAFLPFRVYAVPPSRFDPNIPAPPPPTPFSGVTGCDFGSLVHLLNQSTHFLQTTRITLQSPQTFQTLLSVFQQLLNLRNTLEQVKQICRIAEIAAGFAAAEKAIADLIEQRLIPAIQALRAPLETLKQTLEGIQAELAGPVVISRVTCGTSQQRCSSGSPDSNITIIGSGFSERRNSVIFSTSTPQGRKTATQANLDALLLGGGMAAIDAKVASTTDDRRPITPGVYDLTVKNAAGAESSPVPFTITSADTGGQASVSSVSPTSGTPGSTIVSVTGRGFTPSTVLQFGTSTVARTDTAFENSSQMRFIVPQNTVPGSYEVKVDGQQTTPPRFTVNAPGANAPTVTDIRDNNNGNRLPSIERGRTDPIILIGTKFIESGTNTVEMYNSLLSRVRSIPNATPVSSSCRDGFCTSLSVPTGEISNVALGNYRMRVVNTNGESGFVVLQVRPSATTPSISRLNPEQGAAESTVTVEGQNFTDRSVILFGQTSITPSARRLGTTPNDSDQLDFVVPPRTPSGRYEVRVRNGNNANDPTSEPRTFTVITATAPTITRIIPNSVEYRTNVTVNIVGMNFTPTGNTVVLNKDINYHNPPNPNDPKFINRPSSECTPQTECGCPSTGCQSGLRFIQFSPRITLITPDGTPVEYYLGPHEYFITVSNTNGTSPFISTEATRFTVRQRSTGAVQLEALDPVRGPVNTMVTARGRGFSLTKNKVNFDSQFIRNVTSTTNSDGTMTLRFRVPPVSVVNIDYQVSITNEDNPQNPQTSNSLPFRVTATSTPPSDGVDSGLIGNISRTVQAIEDTVDLLITALDRNEEELQNLANQLRSPTSSRPISTIIRGIRIIDALNETLKSIKDTKTVVQEVVEMLKALPEEIRTKIEAEIETVLAKIDAALIRVENIAKEVRRRLNAAAGRGPPE